MKNTESAGPLFPPLSDSVLEEHELHLVASRGIQQLIKNQKNTVESLQNLKFKILELKCNRGGCSSGGRVGRLNPKSLPGVDWRSAIGMQVHLI